MVGDSKLVAFAATAMPEQAKVFYSSVLNLTELADTPFALVFNANGTTLRIQKVESISVPEYTVLGWEVTDIVATVQDLMNKGVPMERFAGSNQDTLGIWKTPDGAMVAWFKDPDGNMLSVTQSGY
jgi:predicted enzyme related to lactoylglutathione lyase